MTDPTHQEDSQIDKALGEDWPGKRKRGTGPHPDQFADELAELREDKARLDWLTERRGVVMETDVGRWYAATPRTIFAVCDSPRAAIDAARKTA